MGQRANYIIKNDNELMVFYHHWRATNIIADLYLGKLEFINFVRSCKLSETIIDEPWIEGCVIIDISALKVYFWTNIEKETSVMEYYLTEVNKKWAPWNVSMLANQMSDVEAILNIDYVSKQEKFDFHEVSMEDIINDKVDEYETTCVIIKEQDKLFVTKTASISPSDIIQFGENILSLILDKPNYDLPVEGVFQTYNTIIIDIANKQIFINSYIMNLWDLNSIKWNNYKFTMGDYGYLYTLQLAGIATKNLKMPIDKIEQAFQELIKQTEGFNPFAFAEKFLEDYQNAKFNPNFFDNQKP